jgi:hypothetical protein
MNFFSFAEGRPTSCSRGLSRAMLLTRVQEIDHDEAAPHTPRHTCYSKCRFKGRALQPKKTGERERSGHGQKKKDARGCS